MALSYRAKKKWQMTLMLAAGAAGIATVYAGIRMLAGLTPVLIQEFDHAVRSGATIGLFLGIFLNFFVYAERGALFRRLGFVAGWLMLEIVSTALIVSAIVFQRTITALLYRDLEFFTAYFSFEIVVDTLFALVVFLVITFFMQLRRLVGEGIMWKMMTGRYHEPRKERRVYMFLDMKDSTAIAERLGDEKTHALIAEVFFDADRLVAEHRGEVLSYNGDELVATWLEDVGLKDGRCLECYADIIQSLNAKSGIYQNRFGLMPEFWAGFHVGDVMVGECGDSKLSIVHIGDTPNTAARLEHHAKESGHDCLASDALIDRLTLPKSIKASPLGTALLKGHSHETGLFAIELA